MIKQLFKTRLAFKIWYTTMIIMISTLLLVSLVFNSFFNFYTLNTQMSDAEKNTAYVADNFSITYENLLRAFIKVTVSAKTKYFLNQLTLNPSRDYIHLDNTMQNIIGEYTASNELIRTAMIVQLKTDDVEPSFYHSYYVQLTESAKSWDLGYNLDEISGIHVLDSSESIFTNNAAVIPIAIPLVVNNVDEMILIADNMTTANFILYLFLDTKVTESFLSKYCDDRVEGQLYLADDQGNFLNYIPTTVTDSEGLNDLQSLADFPPNNDMSYTEKNGIHYFIHDVDGTDFHIINAVPDRLFTESSQEFHQALLWIAFTGFFTITCLCLILSSVITDPLKKLMASVDSIKSNNYKGLADIKNTDEMGQLNHAINNMYHTIQKQIQIIKHEEKEKYDAKIQVLAEQINPHFLYNAFEFINMEILNENNEIASDMLANLGQYLRLTLAYPDGKLTIAQELSQTRVYLNIMNHRYSNRIQLTTRVDPSLTHCKIIKSILQPFVENSIKYGFNLIIDCNKHILPTIHIAFTIKDERVHLSITDNGSGFNETEIKGIMLSNLSDDKRRHIGLNNVYQRLVASYKDVSVRFQSIPFVQNTIEISLPKEVFFK